MKLVDANAPLYAVNRDAPHHEVSRRWLDDSLSGSVTVAFAWIALLAFVRLSTKAGLFPSPLDADGALDRVRAWTTAAPAVVLEPTPDHAAVLQRCSPVSESAATSSTTRTWLLWRSSTGCTIVSFDNDFSRFEGVTWARPSG